MKAQLTFPRGGRGTTVVVDEVLIESLILHLSVDEYPIILSTRGLLHRLTAEPPPGGSLSGRRGRRPLQGEINSVRRRDFVRKWGKHLTHR